MLWVALHAVGPGRRGLIVADSRPAAWLLGIVLAGALSLGAAGAAARSLTCTGASPDGASVTVRLDAPAPGGLVEDAAPCDGVAVVEGAATASGQLPPFDLYLLVDASGSSGAASGIDVDRDGFVGQGGPTDNTDPGDSILAAEVLAARRLLGELSGLDVRVALVDFSAVLPDPSLGQQGRLRLVTPLTGDLDAVRLGLDAVAAAGAAGATDYAGPLDLALAEHVRAGSADRSPVVVFMTDGKPTFPRFPFDSTEIPDLQAALAAAERLAAAGLRLEAFGIGTFDDQGLLADMAALTGGSATADLSAEDLLDALPSTRFTRVESVRVINDVTGQEVEAAVAPDGSFRAEIGLVPDLNPLRVIVVPEGGSELELECSTFLSYSCFEEVDLCFRETTEAVLEELMAAAGEQLGGLSELTACEVMALGTDDGPCAAALREYLALVVNARDGRLTDGCALDLGPGGPEDAAGAVALVRALIESGTPDDCALAASLGRSVNTGEAVSERALPEPEPVECVLEDAETGLSLEITIVSPVHGQERPATPPCDGQVEVEGVAEVAGLSNLFDLFFVIDSSGSTAGASGRDIDGDGVIGADGPFGSTDPGDSVLEAELQAVRQFVQDLDPATARVAIIEFAAILDGTDGRMRIVSSLTPSFAQVAAALDEISALGSAGATDYGGAIRLLNQEFLANARPAERIPICFFLSDGIPTFPEPPFNTTEPLDRQTAMDAATESAALGIEINTFEVGPAGAAAILTEIADLTGGEFFPALVAGDIVDVLNDFNLVDVRSVTIDNLTTGASAVGEVAADGSFSGRIGLQAGSNELAVTVVTAGAQVLTGTCETTVELLFENLLCNPLPAAAWAARCLVRAEAEARIVAMSADRGSGDLTVRFEPGPGVEEHRAYRGDLRLLPFAYGHASPFSGLPGDPECLLQAGRTTFTDPGVLGDGRDWYYLVAGLGASGPAAFGAADVDGDGRPDFARPRPSTDPTDLVVDGCP